MALRQRSTTPTMEVKMAKSPLKVVEERLDAIEKLIDEKSNEIVSRIAKKVERSFEHILSSIVKNTEGNLGRALTDSSKKTTSKKGKCTGCKKVFRFFDSIDKHHLVDEHKKFNGICKVTGKKAKAVNV
jgi:tetrahydromethanopterin S-methyltransferase subunit G